MANGSIDIDDTEGEVSGIINDSIGSIAAKAINIQGDLVINNPTKEDVATLTKIQKVIVTREEFDALQQGVKRILSLLETNQAQTIKAGNVQISRHELSAWEYLNKGDYNTALEVSEKALKIDPNNASAWYDKGIALDILTRYEEAIVCFDRSIQLEPTVYAFLAKSRSLSFLGKHEEVIRACDEALMIDPQYGAAWYNKAGTLEQLLRYEEALVCYDKVLDPKVHMLTSSEAMFTVSFDYIWFRKGNVLYNLGRYKEALECYDESLKINPDNADALGHKAIALKKLG